jgi:DNA-binding CsgD family transcriptional regulator
VALAEQAGVSVAKVWATRATEGLPFGALAPLLPSVHHGETGEVDDRADLLRRSAAALVEQAGASRFLLFVDDAHLLDDGSAALVQQLVASDHTSVLVTVRTGCRVPDPILSLWKDGLAERLEIEGLTAEAIESVLSTVLAGPVDPGTVGTFVVRSEGNMLFLRELVIGAIQDGTLRNDGGLWYLAGPLSPSDRLIELVENRLTGLSHEFRQLLELISFAEPIGTVELGASTTLGRLEELEDLGLIVSTRNRDRLQISLAHPVYGEVLRSRVSPLRVRSIARTLAEGVEATGARRREDTLRIGTWRLEAGGVRPELMLAAAETARWRYDFVLAERLAHTTFNNGGGFEAGLLVAQLAMLQGRDDDANAQLDVVSGLATTDAQRARVAITRLDTNSFFLGDAVEGLRIAEKAEREITDPKFRNEITSRRISLVIQLQGHDAGARIAEPLLETAEGAAFVWGCCMASLCFGRQGGLEEALDVARRGYTAHLALQRPISWYPWLHTWFRCEALSYGGRFAEAHELASEQYEQGLAERSTEAQAFFAWHLARTATERGHAQPAVQHALEAVSLFRQLGRPLFVYFTLATLINALALARRTAEALDAVAAVEALGISSRYREAEVALGRAWIAVAQGNLPEGRRLLDEAATLAAASGDHVAEAAALHGLARLGRAKDVADRLDALTQVVEGELMKTRALHARSLARSDPQGLTEVSEAFEAMGTDLFAAESAADAARAWERAGDARAATRAEQRAAQLARACADAATPTLESLGDPVRLTPAEREAALLAASGRSNKDIAAQLCLSVRTVENRLQRVYEKLGISRRSDLAAALSGHAR